MKNPLSKYPFLFLLIPLLAGILLQYYIGEQYISIAFFLSGIAAMLFSFLISEKAQFRWRWLFGCGAFLFAVGIGIVSTSFRQQQAECSFSGEQQAYRGIVMDSPQEKPRTVAYRVYLPDEDKQIVCYFQLDSLQKRALQPGYEFIFRGQILPFRNMGNPDDFDYVRYMYNQGFAGSVYVADQSWQATGEVETSLKYTALRYRQQIMDFYRSLGFSDDEYAILSALTLGYQDELSDELIQGFRTTGTVHVLSVSGLHVGIIYMMISFLLGFIRRGDKYYWLKPILIILLLWLYAFITGLPASVVRASLMLTVFCASELFGKKSFSLHALFITAFFMLLYNPFQLFDIGFQLSFVSVLSILLLHPSASALLKTENKYLKYTWQMLMLSVVTQLATFPVCLYYFGTFPSYFFVANLIIVPLVSLITYAVGGVALAKVLSLMFSGLSFYFYYLPVKVLQFLVAAMTSVIGFIERLPLALIDEMKISLVELSLIFTIIVTVLLFLFFKKAKFLIVALFSVLVIVNFRIVHHVNQPQDNLTVYNRRQATEIRWNVGSSENVMRTEDMTDGYKLVGIGDYRTMVVSSDLWKDKFYESRFDVDNLVLTNDNSLSLYSLMQVFSAKNIILDASLSTYTRHRLTKECQKLNIPCHDVVVNGAFSFYF